MTHQKPHDLQGVVTDELQPASALIQASAGKALYAQRLGNEYRVSHRSTLARLPIDIVDHPCDAQLPLQDIPRACGKVYRQARAEWKKMQKKGSRKGPFRLDPPKFATPRPSGWREHVAAAVAD